MEVEKVKQRFHLDGSIQLVTCYEAGRDGFWLLRFLSKQKTTNQVIDSSSIEVNPRQRRAKAGSDAPNCDMRNLCSTI